MPYAFCHVTLHTILHREELLVDELPSHSCHSSPAMFSTFNLVDVLDVDVVPGRNVHPVGSKHSFVPSYVHPTESNSLVHQKFPQAVWNTSFTPTYVS